MFLTFDFPTYHRTINQRSLTCVYSEMSLQQTGPIEGLATHVAGQEVSCAARFVVGILAGSSNR